MPVSIFYSRLRCVRTTEARNFENCLLFKYSTFIAFAPVTKMLDNMEQAVPIPVAAWSKEVVRGRSPAEAVSKPAGCVIVCCQVQVFVTG